VGINNHSNSIPNPQLDFTLAIYDSKICVIQIRKEQEKDLRVGVAIYNPRYASAQKQYFNSLWNYLKEDIKKIHI